MTIFGLLLTGYAGPIRAETADLIGRGDKLTLRVLVWSEDDLTHVPWDGIGGDYAVNAAGQITLPLIGSVPAADQALPDLGAALSERLQAVIGREAQPSVAIEVQEYAPLYVMGDVDAPGAYEARPGLTALQAMALAGGPPRLDTRGVDLRGVLRDEGTLVEIDHDILRHRIRAARLSVEMTEATEFRYDGPAGAEDATALVREEQAVFAARRRALALETENLVELKTLLTSEVANLETKRSALAEQIALSQETLRNVESLRESGLARAVEMREAQRTLFELQSQDIDIQNGIYRSRQRLKEADREILALNNRRVTETTQELQTVNATLKDLGIRRAMLSGLVALTGGTAMQQAEVQTIFHLTRGSAAAEQIVPPATPLGRGDILRVERTVAEPGG